jgi:hypothetical protein
MAAASTNATVADVEALTMGVEHPLICCCQRFSIGSSPLSCQGGQNGNGKVCDPTQRAKRACRWAIGQAMAQLGILDFPFFERKLLKLKVTFGLPTNLKDTDNPLNFLMDALESVLYDNDTCVVDAHPKKRTAPFGEQHATFELEQVEQFIWAS